MSSDINAEFRCRLEHGGELDSVLHVQVDKWEEARHLIRTISNSPQLGKYLNSIEILGVIKGSRDEILSHRLHILETIIQHCPNITKIGCSEKEVTFWTRLMHAGMQGQLPYLKVLPRPDCFNWESYAYTALLFKSSLTSSHICGDDNLGGYRTICDQIGQFKNLQHLNFEIRYYTYLTHFDSLIEKCPHLKELLFEVKVNAIQRPSESEPESIIRPRPNIHVLRCDWELAYTESQLEYVMRKYPSLQTFRTWANEHETKVFGPSLIKFMRYVMSKSVFEIRIFAGKEDLLNIFIDFMKRKNRCKTVSIGYSVHTPPLLVLSTLYLHVETGAAVNFIPNTGENEAAHIRFLSKIETVKGPSIDL
ncbi:hypothetical protein MFLAVUS_005449 [Mucor flavus]|uniref:Uncharacterized protein n=1 Tax=Mucor flavus TaxID=439312 RepID=A0ABP9YYR9_9FUNG